jgi:hypothetical protein
MGILGERSEGEWWGLWDDGVLLDGVEGSMGKQMSSAMIQDLMYSVLMLSGQ